MFHTLHRPTSVYWNLRRQETAFLPVVPDIEVSQVEALTLLGQAGIRIGSFKIPNRLEKGGLLQSKWVDFEKL